jgi:hypothetical protein
METIKPRRGSKPMIYIALLTIRLYNLEIIRFYVK